MLVDALWGGGISYVATVSLVGGSLERATVQCPMHVERLPARDGSLVSCYVFCTRWLYYPPLLHVDISIHPI